MEVVHEGWLKKSPPEKRLWRGKWRRRFFVLRQSGQIPGQYILEYFTDQSCRKLKGHIDLDQCEQVDSGVSLGLVSRKCSYAHVFDIRTPKRLYYLVADAEEDMFKWVDCICSVCGLKMHEEELDFDPAVTILQPLPSPTPSSRYGQGPTTGVVGLGDQRLGGEDVVLLSTSTEPSGPYIPISECHTGTNGFLLGGASAAVAAAAVALDFPPPQSSMDDDEDESDDGDEEFAETFVAVDSVVPPPPPKSSASAIGPRRCRNDTPSGEFYDYPRQIHPRSLDEDFYSVPLLAASDETTTTTTTTLTSSSSPPGRSPVDGLTTIPPPPPPPKVNWETYPRGNLDSNYDDHSISPEQDYTYDHPPVPCEVDGAAVGATVVVAAAAERFTRLGLNDSGIGDSSSTSTSSASPRLKKNGSLESVASLSNKPSSSTADGTMPKTSLKAPPRPPKAKPHHLIISLQHQSNLNLKPNLYDNIEDCEAMLYDIPPASQGVSHNKNLPANAFAPPSYLKDVCGDQVPPVPVPVPLSLSSTSTVLFTNQTSLDEMYDFPRPLHEDQLNATPPAPSGDNMTHGRRHAYTNAPTTSMAMAAAPVVQVVEADAQDGRGGCGIEDAAADNDDDDDEYLSMEAQKHLHQKLPQLQHGRLSVAPRRRASSGGGDAYTDMSGGEAAMARSPASSSGSIYSNVPSPMQRYDNVFILENPPAVDRNLKPQRRASEASIGSPPSTLWSPNLEASLTSRPSASPSAAAATVAAAAAAVTSYPPKINRTLKPKRVSTDSGEGVNTGHGMAVTLSLPPAGHHRQQTHKKRSFRRPKEIPNANVATSSHSRLLTNGSSSSSSLSSSTLHPPPHLTRQNARSDRSSSDDDLSSTCSSRRNSSNDDHAPSKGQHHVKSPSPSPFLFGSGRRAPPPHHHLEPEIQYLDLDLESEAAVAVAAGAGAGAGASVGAGPNVASVAASLLACSHSPKSQDRLATNTVYKTVDFVKTKAFNEMRQNVEETYRKSQ